MTRASFGPQIARALQADLSITKEEARDLLLLVEESERPAAEALINALNTKEPNGALLSPQEERDIESLAAGKACLQSIADQQYSIPHVTLFTTGSSYTVPSDKIVESWGVPLRTALQTPDGQKLYRALERAGIAADNFWWYFTLANELGFEKALQVATTYPMVHFGAQQPLPGRWKVYVDALFADGLPATYQDLCQKYPKVMQQPNALTIDDVETLARTTPDKIGLVMTAWQLFRDRFRLETLSLMSADVLRLIAAYGEVAPQKVRDRWDDFFVPTIADAQNVLRVIRDHHPAVDFYETHFSTPLFAKASFAHLLRDWPAPKVLDEIFQRFSDLVDPPVNIEMFSRILRDPQFHAILSNSVFIDGCRRLRTMIGELSGRELVGLAHLFNEDRNQFARLLDPQFQQQWKDLQATIDDAEKIPKLSVALTLLAFPPTFPLTQFAEQSNVFGKSLEGYKMFWLTQQNARFKERADRLLAQPAADNLIKGRELVRRADDPLYPTERPDWTLLPLVFKLKALLLMENLARPAFRVHIARYLAGDLTDHSQEWGGLFQINPASLALTLHPLLTMPVDNHSTYVMDPMAQDGGFYFFHQHAVYDDGREYAGPSSPDLSTTEQAVGEASIDCVITSLGHVVRNGQPMLRFNVDLYSGFFLVLDLGIYEAQLSTDQAPR